MFIERRDDHILLLLGKVRIGSKRDLKYPHVPEISVQISRQRQQHGRVSMPQHVRGKLVNYQLAPFASGAVLAAGAFIQIIHESCPRADIGHSRPQMAVRIRTDQSSF